MFAGNLNLSGLSWHWHVSLRSKESLDVVGFDLDRGWYLEEMLSYHIDFYDFK